MKALMLRGRAAKRRHVAVPLEDAGELFVDDASFAVEARRDIERTLETLPERTHALTGVAPPRDRPPGPGIHSAFCSSAL